MKVRITSDNMKFSIGIPTGLILSKPSVWLYLKLIRKFSSSGQYMPENIQEKAGLFLDSLPEEAAYAICKELRRIKKKHGSWELVSVESADANVNIML